MNPVWKRIIVAALTLAATSTGAMAQNKPASQSEADVERLRMELAQRQELEQKDWQTKLFEIKFAQPSELRQALSMFRAVLNNGGNSRILAVKAPKEIMPAIEDAIKRFDVPAARQQDAELTVWVLMASDQPDGALPASLQPITSELKKVLAYKGFQLIDTLIARGGDNRTTILQGVLTSLTNSGRNASYTFQSQLSADNDGKTALLRLRGMQFRVNIPRPAGAGEDQITIATDVEVPQNQQIIVGKASIADRAIILVMTARF